MGTNDKERSKKLRERYFLDEFLKRGGWPNLEINEGERPDFVIQEGDGVATAVEVTSLFKDEGESGSLFKAGESERDRFLQKLAGEYYKQGGQAIHINALLPPRPDLQAIPFIAHQLQQHRPTNAWSRTELEVGIGSSGLGKLFLVALPERPECDHYSHWRCVNNSTGWVQRKFPLQRLREKIQQKAADLDIYRKAADRVILLVVVDRTHVSGMMEPPLLSEELLPACGFQAIYLFLYPIGVYRVA